ncbi:DUF6286 domain-containing protein [Streptomyces sp. DSM 41972]|uniref:DUF6286 domain-containing protein n=1 Tax=Streptomyces althioticus subsp. attaecolombicae TaxID=3075534 RepID=A0ABU3I4H0_9ACTN|nr:DUF6286 domain-containing protein [Streptomyces sp. DSM 41972]SCD98060.1 hypothetical protein GA0115238_140010 [Streptomyces sp. di50b]SCE43610.1 hypothetical protein GA0115245_136829 [Streptomyces sp. di188]
MNGRPDTTAGPSAPSAESGATTGGASGGRRRFWSPRRVPAGLLALVALVIAGAFLYDIAAVRAHRPGMSWRHDLARQLAERQLDDVWVLTGAAVAAALGLWLLVLALTPGLRSVLTMRRVHPDVRAGLDRDAAATVLRDRALEVAGVQAVRVAVKRRRTDVRAVSHFRDLDDVREDLTAVLEGAIRGLGLARPSPLTLRVRRPGRKGR